MKRSLWLSTRLMLFFELRSPQDGRYTPDGTLRPRRMAIHCYFERVMMMNVKRRTCKSFSSHAYSSPWSLFASEASGTDAGAGISPSSAVFDLSALTLSTAEKPPALPYTELISLGTHGNIRDSLCFSPFNRRCSEMLWFAVRGIRSHPALLPSVSRSARLTSLVCLLPVSSCVMVFSMPTFPSAVGLVN